MPTLLTASDICEGSLRQIGRVPPHEQPTGADMEIALRWLEMVINDAVGSGSITALWSTISVPLVAETNTYNLPDYTGTSGIQCVFGANLVQVDNGRVTPLKIRGQQFFEQLDRDEIGTPTTCFIDRARWSVMTVWPTPPEADLLGNHRIDLSIQTFGTQIDNQSTGVEVPNIRQTWYLWAHNKLAYFIGNGPVRRLPDQELDRIQRDYLMMETRLGAFDNRESDDQPFTDPWGQ